MRFPRNKRKKKNWFPNLASFQIAFLILTTFIFAFILSSFFSEEKEKEFQKIYEQILHRFPIIEDNGYGYKQPRSLDHFLNLQVFG